MRAAAERNRQQITGQAPRSRPPSQPPSRPHSPPGSHPASRPQSPPHVRPDSRPPSRPASRPHSPPSLDPVQPQLAPRAAAARQGLPPRAQHGHALPSGRAAPRDLPPSAAPAEIAAVRHAAVQTQTQPAQHAQQAQQGQLNLPAHVRLPAALQPGAASHLPCGQQPLQQPASPGSPEMLHQVEFVIPGAAGKAGLIPSQRVAELQRAGQEEGSGGSLEGVSELQPIPKLSPRAAAEEEAEYGQMVQEMQQVQPDCTCCCFRTLAPETDHHCSRLKHVSSMDAGRFEKLVDSRTSALLCA